MSRAETTRPSSSYPHRVLLLEDSPFDAELLQEQLLRFYPNATLELTRDGDSFAAALERGGFEVILSDHDLGAYTGSQALDLARREVPHVPFIFVSGVIGEDNVAELIKCGATDYVSKGRLGRLPLVLDRALREAQERAARAFAEAELGKLRQETEKLVAQLARREKEVRAGEDRLKAAT